MKTGLSIFGMAATVALFAGCVHERTVYVERPAGPPGAVEAPATPPSEIVVNEAPPPPQTEVIVAAPGPGYVWTPGYWAWHGHWVWMGGRWAFPPHRHAVWVGGHWAHRGHGHVWVEGRWR